MTFRSSARGAPDHDAFRTLKAAEGGELPEEVQRSLDDLVDAVAPVLGDGASGVVGLRFGRRVIVAPVDSPEDAVDIADVDLARRVILTVGGKDPGSSGSLLAQVLFQRTDAVVGYAEADEIPGPSLDVMQKVLVPLQASPAARAKGAGTVAVGKQASEIGASLQELQEKVNEASEADDGDLPDLIQV